MNLEEIYGKSQKKEKSSPSSDLDLDSLLKLASTLTNQDTLIDKLSKSNLANDSNDVDISNIVEDITKAASHTFSDVDNELSEIKAELKKLNKNIETLLKRK
jgi:hypothetical protein